MTPDTFYAFADDILEVVVHDPPGARVPEALVQDIWLHRRFRTNDLATVDGLPVDVLCPGRLNTDAGPDFLGARLRMGTTLWNGAVEIHLTSADWKDHRHDRDPRYDGTILHVALYGDAWTGRLARADGSALPELVLFPNLEDSLRRLIHSFYLKSGVAATERRILCAHGWTRIGDDVRQPYLRELARERMAVAAKPFAGRNAEEAFYEAVFAGLGFAKNTSAMRTLARLVPRSTCRRIEDPAHLEALLLGAAGLLPGPARLLEADRETADYVMELLDRFERLRHRLDIEPMPVTAWKFFRLRPANFPPLRIAQAAALAGPGGLLREGSIDRLLAAAAGPRPMAALRGLFRVQLDAFWARHVRLERSTPPRHPAIGRQRVDALIANAAIPAILAHLPGSEAGALLRGLPASSNEVTRRFARLGTRPSTEEEVQGLLQLYRMRCTNARCLSCRIGRRLLRQGEAPPGPFSDDEDVLF